MNKQDLKEKLKLAKTRAYGLKTKKARTKAWAHVREIEREILTILYSERDMFARHSIKGTVRRWYEGCEDVFVDTPYGSMWISLTADELSKSWYAHTCCIEYTKGQEIIIEIEMDIQRDDLRLASYPKRVYGGKVNETQYAELCKKGNLAFFKYPDGHMSGLFASGGAK